MHTTPGFGCDRPRKLYHAEHLDGFQMRIIDGSQDESGDQI